MKGAPKNSGAHSALELSGQTWRAISVGVCPIHGGPLLGPPLSWACTIRRLGRLEPTSPRAHAYTTFVL